MSTKKEPKWSLKISKAIATTFNRLNRLIACTADRINYFMAYVAAVFIAVLGKITGTHRGTFQELVDRLYNLNKY